MKFSMKLSRSSVIAFTLALTLGGFGVRTVMAAPAAAASASALARVHIDNFGKVDDSYFRGAQPEGGDYDDLAAIGVKTVIDLHA